MNKRGSVSILVAYATPPITVLGVFAIDLARYWVAEARLQSALDAAALAAARDIQSPNRNANVQAVFNANWNGGAPPRPGEVRDAPPAVTITEPGTDQVQVQASVSVKPLLGVVKIPDRVVPGVTTQVVTRSATSQRPSTGVELALVFDVTGSMGENDGTASGKTRIVSARDAAIDMMKILYGDGPTTTTANRRNWTSKTYVSIVPFNVAVNFGSANTHMLSADSRALVDSKLDYHNGTSWAGCMEVRDFSQDDAAPRGTAGLRRYYWPSTYDITIKHNPDLSDTSRDQNCSQESRYKKSTSPADNVCMGHNDWTAPSNIRGDNNLIRRGAPSGPNLMCPTVPILPLTMDRNKIEERINAMVNLPFSSGTAIPPGLQAGWFTLSPNWRMGSDGWPSAEPSPLPNDGRPAPPAVLPLPYGTENMRKVIVLLSDGDNNWLSARTYMGNSESLVRPESRRVEFFYNAYGHLGADYAGDTRLNVAIPAPGDPYSVTLANQAASTRTAAELALDGETKKLCTLIKGEPDPKTGRDRVEIFAVGLGVARPEHRALMEACVSQPASDYYIHANTSDKLKEAFKRIAQELANLRLSQ